MSGKDNIDGVFLSLISLSLEIKDIISEPTEHIGFEIESKISKFFVLSNDFLIDL